MRSFLYRQRKLVAFLVILTLWLSLFSIWADWVTKPPLDEAMTLSPKGAISKEIRIVNPEYLQLNLEFDQANIPSEQMYSLLGGWGRDNDENSIPSGIRVPIHWELIELPSGSISRTGKDDSLGVTAHGQDVFYRQIGGFKVKTGRYLFKAKILRDVPELAHIKTRLSMGLYGKSSSTWQTTLVWWGSIANYLLVRLLAILFFLVLLWKA